MNYIGTVDDAFWFVGRRPTWRRHGTGKAESMRQSRRISRFHEYKTKKGFDGAAILASRIRIARLRLSVLIRRDKP